MADTPIKEIARGRWLSLLPMLGVELRFLTGKHGPCPMCGGRDRFRFDDKEGDGTFFCSGCGAGDGFTLTERVTGKTFREIATLIKAQAGAIPVGRVQAVRDEVELKRAMQAAWSSSGQPSASGPVGVYLNSRLGRPWASKMIRENLQGQWPRMVSKIDDVDGRGVNLHLTHLTEDGEKAPVVPVKRVMPGKLPDGCAIRLEPAGPVMGIAEGIESAISASILFKIPVWAAVSGVMLSKWIPPQEAEEIWIFGDNDGNYTGQAKAYALAHRLSVQFGRRVEVRIPEAVGEDWNDFLKKSSFVS
jgi:putative DNA primase/helicase